MNSNEYNALAQAAYPTDERLETWADAFEALVEGGAKLVLLWGARADDKAAAKLAKVRAEAVEAGKDGDKAVWQARKAPVASGWRRATPTAQEVRDHLALGGWVGIQPPSVGLVIADVDEGGDEAADQAEHKVGCRALYRQPTGTPGRLHLGWVRGEEEVRGRKWRVPAGGGEIVQGGHQAVVWRPIELLAAVRAVPATPPAQVQRLCAKRDVRTIELDITEPAGPKALEQAVDRAVRAIEDAPDGERNDTAARQAWRAGLAAGQEGSPVEPDEARERVVHAAEGCAPDEAEKARETAGRQFDAGAAEAAAGLRFEVTGAQQRDARAEAHEDLLLEEEVVTEDDVRRLEAWQAGDPWAEPIEPDPQGGEQADASGAHEMRPGEYGFHSHRLGASLVAHERAFPDWVVDVDPRGRPHVWEWSDGAGWAELPWKVAGYRLAAYLEPKQYTLEREKPLLAPDGTVIRQERWVTRPRPTSGGATEMAANVARMMAGLVDFYVDPSSWFDWNPLLLAHPDGTCTDLLTGERRAQERRDWAMARTGVAPATGWRDSWTADVLEENVPSASDRLLLQCCYGALLTGLNVDEMFVWLVGPAGSGKTGTAEAMARAAGPAYTHTIPVGRILSGRAAHRGTGDSFTQVSSKVKLHDARMALVDGEPDEDDVLDAGAYKTLSGAGSSEGRSQGRDAAALHDPRFNCLATANRLPFVKNATAAVHRRTYAIAFPVARSADLDREGRVKQQMMRPEHLATLLAWGIEGAVLVARHGGLPPRTEQQWERARMPTTEEDAGDRPARDLTRLGQNPARDLHRLGRNQSVLNAFRAAWREHATPDPEGIVWLDDRAEGTSPGLVHALDRALERHKLSPAAETRGRFLRKAGFRVDRRTRDGVKMACVLGPNDC